MIQTYNNPPNKQIQNKFKIIRIISINKMYPRFQYHNNQINKTKNNNKIPKLFQNKIKTNKK